MNNTIEIMRVVWQEVSESIAGPSALRAFVEPKDYGADVELSDGRRCCLWEYAVPGPVIDAAVNWAKRHGAVHVTVRS